MNGRINESYSKNKNFIIIDDDEVCRYLPKDASKSAIANHTILLLPLVVAVVCHPSDPLETQLGKT